MPKSECHCQLRNCPICQFGSQLYVTLEPCTGLNKKTPPCCDAVIKAGFRRVVIGASDPTQESAVPRLKAAGIAVTMGILEEDCRRMIAPFLKLRLRGMPYVIAKWAMTADGKIATVAGESRWISSEASRELVHQWRNQVNAVLVGIGTVLRDDPLLTCRESRTGRNPLRIVLDAEARTPLTSKLVASAREAPLLIACLASAPEERRKRLEAAGCRVLALPADARDRFAAKGARNAREKSSSYSVCASCASPRLTEFLLESLLRALGAENLTNLMVEGGPTVLADFFDHRLVDEVRIFIAPKLFGGAAAPGPIGGKGIPSPADALQLENVVWTPVGQDMLLTGAVRSEVAGDDQTPE